MHFVRILVNLVMYDSGKVSLEHLLLVRYPESTTPGPAPEGLDYLFPLVLPRTPSSSSSLTSNLLKRGQSPTTHHSPSTMKRAPDTKVEGLGLGFRIQVGISG